MLIEIDHVCMQVEGERELSIIYRGHRVDIPNADLDEYQMLKVTTDAKATLINKGYEQPPFFGFMFGCSGGSKRKFPLMCDDDWLNLASMWKYAKGVIPIYMLATPTPSKHQEILKELDAAQERKDQIGVGTNNPQICENVLVLSDNDEEEFESLVSSRQAKQWANSLICTPSTQPISITKPKSSPKCGTTSPYNTRQKSSAQKPFKSRNMSLNKAIQI